MEKENHISSTEEDFEKNHDSENRIEKRPAGEEQIEDIPFEEVIPEDSPPRKDVPEKPTIRERSGKRIPVATTPPDVDEKSPPKSPFV